MNLLLNDDLENLSQLLRFYEYFLLSVFVETSLMVAERISPILTGMAITVSGKKGLSRGCVESRRRSIKQIYDSKMKYGIVLDWKKNT